MSTPDGTYYILKQGAKGRAGVYKAKDVKMPTLWTPYVCVADNDATSERAKSLGATVLLTPMDIPGVGRLALYNDPLGASIAILKPDPSMR